jgi:hypothetical protein
MPRFARRREAVASRKVLVFAVLWVKVEGDHDTEGMGKGFRVAEGTTPKVEPPP